MQELLVATKNLKKLKEIEELLCDFPVKITSIKDYPALPDVVEDGKTFRSNAIKKALTISRLTGKLVMGEDSGLEVYVLDNTPGVYSARFAASDELRGRNLISTNTTDEANNSKLLRLLSGYSLYEREARYRCLVALAQGENLIGVVSGTCRGFIAERAEGQNGFGYDPLFYVPEYKKTFGQLDPSIKAQISHRARALQKFRTLIQKHLGNSQ
ncbi:MAG: RdgB/HAM1 family non-canonical purine NTP pyrophosphatase [Candidatus Omnitrophica bacterium]|nr:RdgB/HAM1 family non-canonical purine NTP pyrophosphatase [Candidatus Omnitrophota bacterium]